MADTYTYTARSADDPERVVTFTLRGSQMSVGVGAPLEQIEQAIELGREKVGPEGDDVEADAEVEVSEAEAPTLWIRPLAVSLAERGTGPMRVDDVVASVTEDWLRVRAWVRAGGLRLFPITLMDGRVDNPVAAVDFVEEVQERKEITGFNFLGILDYWVTWLAAGLLALVVFQRSRRKAADGDGA